MNAALTSTRPINGYGSAALVVGALTGGGKTYEINYIWVMDETGILASDLIENGVFSYYERVFISYL